MPIYIYIYIETKENQMDTFVLSLLRVCFLYSFIEGMGMFFSEYPMLIGLNGVSIRL